MGWANKLIGWASGNGAEVNTSGELKTLVDSTRSSVRVFQENDPGLATGTPYLVSAEVDDDFRLRVSNDMILDEEELAYTAQNFTKHYMAATTYVPTFTLLGFNTNPSSLLTAGAAVVYKTYKTFSMWGTETVAIDIEGAFSWVSGAAIPANIVIELGGGLTSNTTPYDIFDGVYIRGNNSGVYGVIRNNSNSDTAASTVFKDYTGITWVPVNGRKYQFILYISTRSVEFWVNDPVATEIWLAADLATPAGFGMPIASPAFNMFARQYQASAPAVAASFQLSRYNVRRGGTNIGTTLNVLAARAGESIYSPGTLTTTANQAVATGSITRPAAAAPANATALVTSASAIVLETPTTAAGTDVILMAFQAPALPTAVATTFAPNRRLRIDAINIASAVQAVLTGGPQAKMFYLAYGSTAVSLAGVAADTVTTKAYRRVQLPIVQAYAAAAAAGSIPSGNASISFVMQTPIYVNPGEFVALVCHNLGTAVTLGTIQHAISFDLSWE